MAKAAGQEGVFPMFCYLCGKELPDGAQFCPACGAKAATPAVEPVPPPPQPPEKPVVPPSQPSATPSTPAVPSSLFRSWKLVAGLVCVAALVLVLVVRELDSDDRLAKPVSSSQSGSNAEESGSGPDDSTAADVGDVIADDGEAGITLPDPALFYQLNDNEVSEGDNSRMFYLHGDAAEILGTYAALLEEAPYSFQPDEEYPWRLDLSNDDVMGGYNLTDPRQENCTVSVSWFYDASLDFTQVQVEYDGGETADSLRWVDGSAVCPDAVTGLDYDKSHTALQAETEARSQSDSDSSSSDSSSGSPTKHDWSFSSQCISCSGSGTCRQCGGTGYVYKIMPGTTERIQVNCTSCYSPGKCRDCGGTGRR